jgi:hypothetical protein
VAIALAIFSVLVVAMSLYGVISPPKILAFSRRFAVSPGIWIATAVRVVLALLLWFTSPVCQTPLVFEVLAALVLVAAITVPAIGAARLIRLVDRLESWPTVVVRLQGLFGIGFGAFLLWSIWPAIAA